MAGQIEGVARGETRQAAPRGSSRLGRASCCMRMSTVRLLSSKISELARLVAAALVDAVEALGIVAGKVVDLELVVAADLQLVDDFAHRHGIHNRLLRLQVLAGQLEAVVPGNVLSRTQFLRFEPFVDAVLLRGWPSMASS